MAQAVKLGSYTFERAPDANATLLHAVPDGLRSISAIHPTIKSSALPWQS